MPKFILNYSLINIDKATKTTANIVDLTKA